MLPSHGDSIGSSHMVVRLGRSLTERADSPIFYRKKLDKMDDLQNKMSLAMYRVLRQCFAFIVPCLIFYHYRHISIKVLSQISKLVNTHLLNVAICRTQYTDVVLVSQRKLTVTLFFPCVQFFFFFYWEEKHSSI